MLSELDDQTRLELVQGLDEHEVSRILDAMPSDHVVDVVEELPKEQADKILDLMEEEKSEEVQELLEYAENTAGRLMSHDFVAVHEFATVAQAIDHIRKAATRDDGFYVYVVDDHDHLVGIVPLHKLLTADPATPVRAVRREGVESVSGRHRPGGGRAAGAAPPPDRGRGGGRRSPPARHHQRGRRDRRHPRGGHRGHPAARPASPGDETVLDPPKAVFTKRLLWRLINLGTAVLAASVIGLFEGSIQSLATLAIFMPIVASMGGIGTTQTATVVVRGIALGDMTRRRPDAGAPEGGLARAHDRRGQRPGPCGDRLPMEGGLAARVDPRPWP